jgi:ribonuclease Z
MEITFLGTSAGVPTRERNVSAVALRCEESGAWTLFDCGEATQHRIIRSPLSLYRLERIYITHLHGDHLYGIFGLLASRGMMMCEAPLEIYGPPGLRELIDTVCRLSQLKLPYELKIFEPAPDTVLEFEDHTMRIIPLSHSLSSYGYCRIERERPGRFDPRKAAALGIPEGPLYGKLQRGERITLPDGKEIAPSMVTGPPRPGRRIAVAGDNDTPELFAGCAPLDLLIHEATYTQADFDRLPRKFRHTTALRLGKAAEQMGVKHLAATHFSPRYDRERGIKALRDEIRENYTGILTLAEDLLTINV